MSIVEDPLMVDLRAFLDGTAKGAVNTDPAALTRVAISLIQKFPATRDAVMEYFGTVFDSSVVKYVEQIEQGTDTSTPSPSTSQEDAMIADIHKVLDKFLQATPKAWAPIISTWSLELLGTLSSRYAGRGRLSAVSGLNEALQLWMSCLATRTLIDVTAQCLSCLMSHDTEACISALLDMSVAHSPHFDWVVAHVGSRFPHTVITRVLSCGLRDFATRRAADRALASAKLGSVVGILGHLAASHFADIRAAMLDLFKASLEGKPGDKATVPFLLQLASLSPTLLRALTSDILQTLSPEMLPRLSQQAPAWCRYFGGANELEALLVRLALGCEQGADQVVRLLLDSAAPTGDKVAKVEIKREQDDKSVTPFAATKASSAVGSVPIKTEPPREDADVVMQPAYDQPGLLGAFPSDPGVGLLGAAPSDVGLLGAGPSVDGEGGGQQGAAEEAGTSEQQGDGVFMDPDGEMCSDEEVQLWSKEILEMLLQDINQMMHSSSTVSVPLLDCLRKDVSAIQPLLLSSDQLRMHTAVRLVDLEVVVAVGGQMAHDV